MFSCKMNVSVDIVIEPNSDKDVKIPVTEKLQKTELDRTVLDKPKAYENCARSLPYVFFECPICSDILDEVVESPCCHKCFCSVCITSWLSKSKECPFCRKLINSPTDCKPCVPIQQIVNNLVVDCPNANVGCEDIVTKGISKEHQVKCLFATVGCPNSKTCEPMYRKVLDEHVKDLCQYREVACTLCLKNVPFYKLEEHKETECQEMEIKCDMNCGNAVLRKDLHEHRNAKCPESYHYCKFYRVGCLQQIKRKEFSEHCQNNLQLHLDLTEKAFEAKEEEHGSLAAQFKSFEDSTNVSNQRYQSQIRAREEKISQQEKEIESLKSLVQRQTRDLTAQHLELESLRKRLNSPSPPRNPNTLTGYMNSVIAAEGNRLINDPNRQIPVMSQFYNKK